MERVIWPTFACTFLSLAWGLPRDASHAEHVSATPWDFIVVGGGVSGCIVADTLSASGLKTLLLESGPPGPASLGGTDVPSEWAAEAARLGRNVTRFDVPGEYHSISWVLPEYNQPTVTWAYQANVLGGGGVLNGAFTMVPSRRHFEHLGIFGWSFDDLQPYVEAILKEMPLTENPSADGGRYLERAAFVFEGAMLALNYTRGSFNANPDHRAGTFGYPPVTASNGQRVSSCSAFLPKALRRTNFQLLTEAPVDKLLLDAGGSATGVAFTYAGVPRTATLALGGRVVLTAGALQTPRLLMLSGIGPQEELDSLEAAGVLPKGSPRVLSPGVGAKLSDHCYIRTRFGLPGYEAFQWQKRPREAVGQYLRSFSGPFAQFGPVLVSYMASPWADDGQPDVEVYIESDDGCTPREACATEMFNVYLMLLRPKSVGNLTLQANETNAPPVPGNKDDLYLKDPTDVQVAEWAVAEVVYAMRTAHPDLRLVDPPTPDPVAIANLVGAYGGSSHLSGSHFAQTCEIGPCADPMSLHVIGSENVHVADASLLPSPLGAHPVLAVEAMAQKAAVHILAASKLDARCSRHHACAGLEGDCCPSSHGQMMGCCSQQPSWLGTSKQSNQTPTPVFV